MSSRLTYSHGPLLLARGRRAPHVGVGRVPLAACLSSTRARACRSSRASRGTSSRFCEVHQGQSSAAPRRRLEDLHVLDVQAREVLERLQMMFAWAGCGVNEPSRTDEEHGRAGSRAGAGQRAPCAPLRRCPSSRALRAPSRPARARTRACRVRTRAFTHDAPARARPTPSARFGAERALTAPAAEARHHRRRPSNGFSRWTCSVSSAMPSDHNELNVLRRGESAGEGAMNHVAGRTGHRRACRSVVPGTRRDIARFARARDASRARAAPVHETRGLYRATAS